MALPFSICCWIWRGSARLCLRHNSWLRGLSGWSVFVFMLQLIDYNSVLFRQLLILRAPLTRILVIVKQWAHPPEGCYYLEHWVFLSCKRRSSDSMTNTISSAVLFSSLVDWEQRFFYAPQHPFLHFTFKRFFMASCQTFMCKCECRPL